MRSWTLVALEDGSIGYVIIVTWKGFPCCHWKVVVRPSTLSTLRNW
jgi:hypothetical protein